MGKSSPISAERHAAIFGPPDDIWKDTGGRRRRCKVCEGWHPTDQPWPHNCREPVRIMQRLAAPMVVGDIEPHVEGGVYIDSRRTQREFMRQNGLVEFEPFTETAGTHRQDFSSRAYQEDLVQDIKRAMEEDPLNRPPPMMIEQANQEATAEEAVTIEGMEVIGDTSPS